MGNGKHVRRAAIGLVGAMLSVIGLAMLVLPGPGLLLVLAGLLVLASEFPALERYVDPVRERAMKAAEGSVSSPVRIAGSVCAGLGLIGAGIAWGLVPQLPLGEWSIGSSLILSGIVLLGLLHWSYRRVRTRRARRAREA